MTFASALSGAGGLAKFGAGVLTLASSNNSYSGGTAINAGAVLFQYGAPANGAIAVSAGAVAEVGSPYVAGLLGVTTTASAGVLAITSNDSETLAFSNSLSLGSIGNNTYSGSLTTSEPTYFLGGGGGTLNLASALTGTNALVISGAVILSNPASSISGPTTISSGTLQLASGGALANSTVNVGSTNGLGFTLGTTAVTLGGLAGSSNLTLVDAGSNAVALTVGGNGASTAYSGVLSGSGASLTKAGSGTLTLSNYSTFTGPTTFAGGVISIGTMPTNMGSSSSLLGQTANLIFNGGMLTYTGGNMSQPNPSANSQGFNPSVALSSGGGTLNTTAGFVSFTGTLSGSGNLTILDTADTTGGPGEQVFFNTTTSNASPSFTGNIILGKGGNIQYRTTAQNAFGTTATVYIEAGGIFSNDNGYNGNSLNTLVNPFVLAGGTLSTQGVNVTYGGPVTIGSGTSSAIGDYSGSSGLIDISGNLQGSGTATTTGTTVVTLSGANSGFAGTWLSTNAATTFTSPAAGSPNATWVANGQGFTLKIPGGGTVSLGALAGNTGTISNGVASTLSTISVGGLGAATTYGGSLSNGSGTLGLNVVGGQLTLSGQDSAGGPINVNAGQLTVSGSITSSRRSASTVDNWHFSAAPPARPSPSMAPGN